MTAYDRRYQVFVSSTYFDLQDERHAIIMALLQLNAIPAGMELFPAADEDAWSLIQGVINDCDYYLLVVGGRYGSIDPVEEVSYTEKEYDYAITMGKPVMAFLHGDPDAIPVGKAEKSEEAQKKLIAFRKKVERAKHVKYWTGPEDLAGKVALSFSQFTKNYPTVGWVHADQHASPETLAEINELRKNLTEMEQALDRARTSPPTGTEALAQGSDQFETWLAYALSYKTPNMRYSRTLTGSVAINPSWDEIFSSLGPLMLDESMEKLLVVQLDSWAASRYFAEVQEHASDIIESEVADVSKVEVTNYKAEVSREDFHTVLIQLMALGLIAKSERRRGVADKGTYWTLTPYGQTRLIQLRAIRRDEPSALSDEPNPQQAD